MTQRITIAGGGLAGLSLGIGLRMRGVDVTVHEAGRYPRHRVCGEFLSGVRDETLERLGISGTLEGARELRTMAWHAGERKIHESELPEPARGISRHVLDDALQRRFCECGGELMENSRLPIEEQEGVIRATGRVPSKGNWIGLKCHADEVVMPADLEMHLGSNGYVGLAAIGKGRVNVCGLFRKDTSLQAKGADLLMAYLRAGGLGGLAERLRSIDRESFTAVAGMRLGWSNSETTCIGDTAGMIPPFTGNGMSMAIESAECALEPAEDYAKGKTSWNDLRERLGRLQRKRFGTRMRIAQIVHPALTHALPQALMTAAAPWIPWRRFFLALR